MKRNEASNVVPHLSLALCYRRGRGLDNPLDWTRTGFSCSWVLNFATKQSSPRSFRKHFARIEAQLNFHAVWHWCRHGWLKTDKGWVHSTKLQISYVFYRRTFGRVTVLLPHYTMHGIGFICITRGLSFLLKVLLVSSWGRQKIPNRNTCCKLRGFPLATGDRNPCGVKFVLILLTRVAGLCLS